MTFSAYYIMKRTEYTSTHESIVDSRIRKVIPYRMSVLGKIFSMFLYIVTLGIFLAVVNSFPKLYIYMFLDECPVVTKAKFFVVVDINDSITIVKSILEHFFQPHPVLSFILPYEKSKKEILKNSIYTGEDYDNSIKETCIFIFDKNKYMFIEETQAFYPIYFDIIKYTHDQIHDLYKKGITSFEDYNYLLNKYGLNLNVNSARRFFYIFLSNLIKPSHLYQLIVSLLGILLIHYYVFYVLVIVFLFITILMESIKTYQNAKRGKNLVRECNIEILRNLEIDSHVIDVEPTCKSNLLFLQ